MVLCAPVISSIHYVSLLAMFNLLHNKTNQEVSLTKVGTMIIPMVPRAPVKGAVPISEK